MISVVRHVYFVPSYLATLLPIKEPVVYHTDASNLNICQAPQINNYFANFVFRKVIKREGRKLFGTTFSEKLVKFLTRFARSKSLTCGDF